MNAWTEIASPVLWVLSGVLVVLLVATVVAAGLRARHGEGDYEELFLRVKSWWWMVGAFAVAILLSRISALVFFAFLSFLALKEYFSLIPTRRVDRRVLFWAYLAIPVQYYWIGIEWYGMFIIFIPVYIFLLLPLRMVIIGETREFLRAVGSLHWGVMTTVFCISHVAYLLVLPAEGNPGTGGAGLVLFLVLLTQFNDVAQYVWGKLLGRRRVIPKVSPNKTWEGLLGAVVTTIVLAALLASWLTPLNPWEAALAGMIIGFAGFVGDVTISALKRDLRVKDTSSLIPGHGGILDRVDSLTYTAPLFFHYVYYLHY